MYHWGEHTSCRTCVVLWTKKKRSPPSPLKGAPLGVLRSRWPPPGGPPLASGSLLCFSPPFLFCLIAGAARDNFFGFNTENTEKKHGKTRNDTEKKNTENTEKHGQTLKTNTKMRFDQKKEPDLYWLFKNKRKHEKKDGWMDGRFDRNTNFDFFGDQISSKTRFRTQRKKTILAKFPSNI